MNTDRYAQLELTIIREEFWSAKPRTEVKLFHDWGLSKAPQEVGYVVAFDGMRNVRTVVEVARGSHGVLDIHIPTVLRAVLMCGGERFTFVHTHPTGNPIPSPADTMTTETIMRAAAQIGLVLEDHLIVTPKVKEYFSFREQGLYVPPTHKEGFEVDVDGEGNVIDYVPAKAAAS